mgnify:CR=1 FL=1
MSASTDGLVVTATKRSPLVLTARFHPACSTAAASDALAAANDRIGYLPEERGLYKKMKVRDILRFYAELKGCRDFKPRITRWLDRMGLAQWADKRVDALSKGMDGVFLMGCKHGDDYQCHFVKGSELAEIRVKKIGEALSSLALEPERVAQFQVAIDEYDKIPQMLQEFMGTIEGLGPNPFKGF